MNKTSFYIIFGFIVFPLVTNAQMFQLAMSSFSGVVGEAIVILNMLQPILVTGSFLVFFWGLTKFILNSASETELVKGRKYMAWSILVLFILMTYRVIITLVSSDLGWGNSINLPFIRTDAKTSKVTTS